MKSNGLYANRKRKFKVTTESKHNYPIAPNLLNQDFKVDRINKVWVSDNTYIYTNQGWLYLTVIIDLFNRKTIGWSLSKSLKAGQTIIAAWHMAVGNQSITRPLIFHSDRGVQYACNGFTNIIKSYNGMIKQSMSRKGNCWDKAVESFFKSLKVEWVYKHKYHLRTQAELCIFYWIESWYNKSRIHYALGYKSIDEFELNDTILKSV